MFTVYCDDTLIFDPRREDLALISPKITLELNKAGDFTFTMSPQHAQYDLPQLMKSSVFVYRDDVEVFSGRPISITTDFYNRKEVECESELAFLNDTIQRPAEYHDQTVRDYLETLIDIHNEQVDEGKQFEVGIVTVEDSNDSLYRYTNYNSTMTEIKEDLVDDLGGYLKVRHEDGTRYLDYVEIEDYGDTSSQTIEFGKNLLDFSRNIDMTDICTAIIPLGETLEESDIEALEAHLTIEDVNDGVDYIQNDEAVETYGFIVKTVEWSDVTTADYLLEVAEEYLTDYQFEDMVIEANAVDLHYSDDDVMQFKLGDQVRVLSTPHGLDRYFPISAMTINLSSPSSDTITLGEGSSTTLTARASSISSELQEIKETTDRSSVIEQAVDQATNLITRATHGYVMLNDLDDDGAPDELVIMDTDDTDTATKVWRWNLNGLGYSGSGYDGEYGTAMTMDGQIVGDYIAAQSVAADKLNISVVEPEDTVDGTITFNAGSIVINSDNFSLDADGDIVAQNAEVEGTLTAKSDTRRAVLDSGTLRFYSEDEDENEIELGQFTAAYKTSDEDVQGLSMFLAGDADYMAFSVYNGDDYTPFMEYDVDGNEASVGDDDTLGIYSKIYAPNFIKAGKFEIEGMEEGVRWELTFTWTNDSFPGTPRAICAPRTMYPELVFASIKEISKSKMIVHAIRTDGAGDDDTGVFYIAVYTPFFQDEAET